MTSYAAQALNGSRAAYKQLKVGVGSANPDVREIALWAYRAIYDELIQAAVPRGLNQTLTVDFVMELSKSQSDHFRLRAAEEMGRRKDRKFVPRLMQMIESDPNHRVTNKALNSWASYSGESMTNDLENNVGVARKWYAKHKSEYE